MYRITCISDSEEKDIFNGFSDNDLSLIDPVLSLTAGGAGSLSFKMLATHPHVKSINVLSSDVVVYKDGKKLWGGRVISDKSDFQNSHTFVCEGDLAFLNDSIIRPYSFNGSVQSFVKQIIESHNSQVEGRKKFLIGNVNVSDSIPNLERSSSEPVKTWDLLKSELVDRNGGFFRVRYEGSKRYIDYLNDFGGENAQAVEYRANLLDLNQNRDPSEIITALIPYGADVDSEDGESTQKVGIEVVNGGKDYIENAEAVKRYGYIFGSVQWSDITEPSELLSVAKRYLNERVYASHSISINAIDLSAIDANIDSFDIGKYTRVKSSIHEGLDLRMMLIEKTINLADPRKDTITLGATSKSFVGLTNKQVSAISENIKRVATQTGLEIRRRVNAATEIITGGRGGYIVLNITDDGHTDELLVMNEPDISTAKHVIRLNQNGLGFSTDGYDPTNFNAAITIDGQIVANYITSGEMLADRIRGGTFEVGGKELAKDGRINVRNANGDIIGIIDKDGIQILDGEIKLGRLGADSYNFTVDRRGKVSAKMFDIEGLSEGNTIHANEIICDTLDVRKSTSLSGLDIPGQVACTDVYINNQYSVKDAIENFESRISRLEEMV